MRRPWTAVLAAVPLAGLAAAGRARAAPAWIAPPPAVVVSSVAQAGGPGYRADLVHLDVAVGPGRATTCDVVGELFLPTSASPAHRVPVVLTTNGFGGSYRDQVAMAEYLAPLGYATLTYSGLGFGGSGCRIELDDPAWDGEAASQLISYLGDRPEITSDGPDDPRVGMIGGSYGGAVQFSTAAVDPRLDTIVPLITWNDLSYSLAPDNAVGSGPDGPGPGVLKLDWTGLFFADGVAGSLVPVRPTTLTSCPGFDPRVCSSLLASVVAGYPTPATVDLLRATSMVSFYRRVHVPVMLMQGEGDSLFTIAEAVRTYQELRSVGDTVKLVIQSWGHSSPAPAPGELSFDPGRRGYETTLITDWFARYLQRRPVPTGPAIEYFRDWVPYHGSAQPAYGSAPSWPVGTTTALYLSGDGRLVPRPSEVVAGSRAFVNLPAVPTSYSETSGLQHVPPLSGIGPVDVPATFSAFVSSPLPAPVDSVGIPRVTVDLSGTVPAGRGAATDPVVFAKLYDVAPGGRVTLVERLASPARLAGETGPVTITLPGVVHRYPAGDRIELVLSAGDAAYLGSRIPEVLTVHLDPRHPSALEVPVVGAAAGS